MPVEKYFRPQVARAGSNLLPRRMYAKTDRRMSTSDINGARPAQINDFSN